MPEIIDFDTLIEEEQPKFKLLGQEWTIPPITYEMTLHTEKIREKMLKDALKKDEKGNVIEVNDQIMLKGYIDTISLVIPDLKDELEGKVSLPTLRRIQKLINKAAQGNEEAVDEEVAYYRTKYADEYRINLLKKEESTEETENQEK